MAQATADMVLELPARWVAFLRDQPESGMTCQMVTVVLKDGRRFERVPYVSGQMDSKGIELEGTVRSR